MPRGDYRITYAQTRRNAAVKSQKDTQLAYSTGGVGTQLYFHGGGKNPLSIPG